MTGWDVHTTLLLFFTALVTPYEVGYLATAFGPLFIVNRYVDLGFIVDISFQFFLPFSDNQGRLRTNHSQILRRYAKSWMMIDIVSVLPFDTFTLLLQNDDLETFKVLRIVRLLRLAKLLRILRGLRILKRWEARLNINYAMMHLFTLLGVLLLLAHWFSCLWAMLLDGDAETFENVFVTLPRGSTVDQRYMVALLWSTGMMTGKGGIVKVTLNTDFQKQSYLVFMICGAVCQAFLIGGVVSLLHRFNEKSVAFQRIMDVLNSFISEKKLMYSSVKLPNGEEMDGADFCERIRSYYIFRHNQGLVAAKWQEINGTCSKFMRSAIAWKMHATALRSVRSLRRASEQMLVFLSTRATSQVYTIRDHVVMPDDPIEFLYLVERGSVLVRGTRIIGPGEAFGEEVMFTHKSLPCGYSAICTADTVLIVLDRKTLEYAINKFGGQFFRARLKMEGTVRQVGKAVRRAAKIVVATLEVEEGVNVLMEALSIKRNVLMEESCPVIAYLEAYCRKQMCRLHDGLNFEEVMSTHWTSTKHYAMRLGKVLYGFRKIEQRQKFLTLLANHRRRHLTALKTFLAGEHFDQNRMTCYLHSLHTEHNLTLPLLRKASAGDLVAVGIPLADALRIHIHVLEYPLQPVEAEGLGEAPKPQQWQASTKSLSELDCGPSKGGWAVRVAGPASVAAAAGGM